ncbi:MAG: CPBP family intramembrane metalloprotease [Bacteroidales bacterium]|nr:CPBP family intramembrane metalloprotease [Bacteroidales bacterium]
MKTENPFTRSLAVRIMISFGLMSIGLVLFSVIATLLGASQSKFSVMLLGVVQNLIVFAGAAMLTAKICYRNVLPSLKMKVKPSWRGIAMVVAVYIVSIPALNWLVDWNEHITFPASMQSLYDTLKHYEDLAKAQTDFMLKGNDLLTMLLMTLQVGVLTGFGEEIFFRGAVLGAFERKRGLNIHISVWTVGIIFSAIHFQFFGFFPRCYLGIWLGYLFVWSRSLWLPVIAHALNNGLVVIIAYLAEQHLITAGAIDSIGVPAPGEFPLLALASAIATLALIITTHQVLKIE